MSHLFFKLRSFLAKIQSELFDDDDNCCNDLDFFGELVVTGKGRIKIELNSLSDHKHFSPRKKHALQKKLNCCPKHINVKFVHDSHHVPCNPIHYDELWWQVKRNYADNWILTINWKVTDARTIRWEVNYCE